MVKQISVFVENKRGRVKDILKALANANVDIKALSLADTTEFGIMRMIVDNDKAAKDALSSEGVVIRVSEITTVAVDDTPGALMNTFDVLDENEIAVEYMYAFAEKLNGMSVIAIRTDNPDLANDKLREKGVKVLVQDEVNGL